MISKKEPHILIIPSWYPQAVGDIGGSFFREQAIALSKRGYKVGVIAPIFRSLRDWKGVFFKPYGFQQESDEGVVTYRWHGVNFTPRVNKFSKASWVRAGLKLFNAYVKNNGMPDIIHVHSLLYAGFVAEKINFEYKIPYVVTEHSSAFARGLVSRKETEDLQVVVANSSENIAVSGAFKEYLGSEFENSLWGYIPNIVNDEFLRADLIVNKPNKNFTFINVCLLSENKRVDLLIKAFAEVSKGITGLKLKIGGDGSIKEQLIELTQQLGITDHVEFLGSLSRVEVLKHVSESDAFVLASEYETFGVVLIEALALGKPVVATRCGGPESIVTSKVGYLVEKNSVQSLAQGMKNLYAHKKDFTAESIRQYCHDNFGEDAVVGKLGEIYQTVLKEYSHDSQ